MLLQHVCYWLKQRKGIELGEGKVFIELHCAVALAILATGILLSKQLLDGQVKVCYPKINPAN